MAVITATDSDYIQILENNEHVLVKFFADWCGTCRLLSPKFRRFSEDDENKNIVFLDVNAEENQDFRKRAGVDNLPFFALFYKGQLIEGTATSKEEKILELIEKTKK